MSEASCLVVFAVLTACSDGSGSMQVGRSDGNAAAAPVTRVSANLPPARPVRFVKLEQLTEWSGQAWAAMAEFDVLDSTGAAVERKSWKVSADSADINDQPANAVDGNPATNWHTRWQGTPPPPPHAFTVDLGVPIKVTGFRYLPRQDKTLNGNIAKYRFYVSADGVDWKDPVATGDFSNAGLPTAEKTVVFAEQTENHAPVVKAPTAQRTALGEAVSLQIIAGDDDGDVLTYAATGLPTGLTLSARTGLVTGTPIVAGDFVTSVSASDHKGPITSVAFQWAVQPPAASADTAKPAPGEVRFVKLEEVSELNGKPWASMAEFNLVDARGANLPRTGWTASADSADANDLPGNAIDGNAGSLWHTQWDGDSPAPPHSFIVDLRRYTPVHGFRYLPRQDKLSNGIIAKFRFYTSTDGVDWGRPVAEGDLSAMGAPNAEKTVLLK